MKISIIIPTYNEEKVIGHTLDALIKSRYRNDLEIIVSDGGSTDRTREIAGTHARVIESEPGRGRQMNAAVREATGDIFLFLHADTGLPESWYEDILREMDNADTVGGAFSLSIDSRRASIRVISFFANLRSRLFCMPYGDQGIFCRRSVFQEISGFREWPVMEDLDFVRRLARFGRISILPQKVLTSARRWEKEGPFFTTTRNWLLVSLYMFGVPPERLYKLYKAVR